MAAVASSRPASQKILFAVRTPKGRPYRCSCPKSTEFLLGETI
ncbi:hypothetical protein D3OALGA1CA_1024 [Olavius algarvensis associated proteobacterium Delta 3]|nr:hypothetical protein D3OALGA1CA_1024 [Olavius algarvensis associated proteobacterium Delta 3]CAB5130741.1 hypothetical protein D3OALGB2SA_3614 [Olavius algarvensis associated proteobacterium Delta 3]